MKKHRQGITKTEARRRALGCGISLTDMRFAKHSREPIFIRCGFLTFLSRNTQREGNITLLLYDNRDKKDKLPCLQVPTSHFHKNRSGLIEQMAQGRRKFRIRLSADKNDRHKKFCDTWGKGRISFAQFHRGEC